MGLLTRLLTAWVLVMVALAGGRYEVSAGRQTCQEGCHCCSEAAGSCCASRSRVKITSPCGCGHDEGHPALDLSAIEMEPLAAAIGAPRRANRFPAVPTGLVPPGRVPSPETPPPRVRA